MKLFIFIVEALALLLAGAVVELIKRPIFILIYPFAYTWRAWARRVYRNSWLAWLLWLTLDDSIRTDSRERCGQELEYCCYGKRSALVELLPAGAFKEFMRAWAWGAWRNNGINATWEFSMGERRAVLFGLAAGRCFFEIRLFRSRHYRFPYLELWAGPFRFQAGWITNGRWQIQLRRRA